MYEIYNSDPYNANALTILIKISHKNTFKVYLSVNRYISDSIKGMVAHQTVCHLFYYQLISRQRSHKRE